jgi:hypothetical protein
MHEAPPDSPRFCLSCRYNLAGLVTRECPECARPFDPADPTTTAEHPTLDERLLYARAAKVLTVAMAIIAAAAAIICALGTDSLLRWIVGVLLSPLVLLLLFMACQPSAPLTPRWRLSGVLAAVVFISIIVIDWPFRITFELHRPAMNRAAAQIRAGQLATGGPTTAPTTAPTTIGLFSFINVRTTPEGNIGFQLTGGPGGGEFLVHRARGSTWVWYNTNWEQNLLGGWYRVYED